MKVFSVTEINRLIKNIIDNEMLFEEVTITGELSSFSISRNIAYFTLKDSDNLLSCVQFGCKQEFKIGDMVQCTGNIKYYPKGGKLSLNAYKIEHCGVGELYQQFLRLKAKLEVEGLFDPQYKIPIPKYVNSIGVVTSSKGAVLQDIRNIGLRRNPNLEIQVYDAQVQGNHAVADIIQGITYFDNLSDVDVIIVARGGGSVEDLSVFNDEELARIVHICNKPIISAVGHETDFTIIDFVADLRAPTPSAAAEIVTFDHMELRRYILDLVDECNDGVNNLINNLYNALNINILNIDNSMSGLINDEILYINSMLQDMDKMVSKKIDDTRYRVDVAINTLDKLNPIRLLQSGYSIVTHGDKPIDDSVNVGDNLEIVTVSNKLTATVIGKEDRC